MRRRGKTIKVVKRICLNCEKKFTAQGKYNRLCTDCRQGIRQATRLGRIGEHGG